MRKEEEKEKEGERYLEEGEGVGRKLFLVDLPIDFLRENGLKQIVGAVGVERWFVGEEDEHHHTKTPQITALSMASTRENLRGDVGGTARETEDTIVVSLEDRRETKVSETDMAVDVEQDVVEFQVSIDDVFVVEVLEGQEHFSAIKLAVLVRPSVFTSFEHVVEQ